MRNGYTWPCRQPSSSQATPPKQINTTASYQPAICPSRQCRGEQQDANSGCCLAAAAAAVHLHKASQSATTAKAQLYHGLNNLHMTAAVTCQRCC